MRARVLCLLAAATMVLAGVASAAVPPYMNYQGILLDGGGNPITTQVTVVFTIHDASTLGNNLWDEERQVTPDADGRFNINLGEGDPLTDAVFAAQDRWLGIKVGADPEMSPRTRLVTVPYAYRLATVDGSTGGTITGNVTVAGGNLTLDNSTPTAGNVLKGGDPFIHNFGISNTFIGRNAGNLTMTGVGCNTATGENALLSNTIGSYNAAIGYEALSSNTTGYYNTASGFQALYSTTAGIHNTASGSSALYSNTTGSGNTASGWKALYSNTEGYYNTASGREALHSNTTGNWNTASGWQALYYNTGGRQNTASGTSALFYNTIGNCNAACGAFGLRNNTIGYNNTACGDSALYYNTTGYQNTACGSNALYWNATGYRNTAIGYSADVSAQNLTNATAIGYDATVNASNKIRLGNAAVTVIEGQVAYTFPSDRNQKENFRPVNGDEVLRKLRGLSITSWNMIGHDPQQFRHYGPVAQDFFAAFGHDGVGQCGDSTTINSGDMAGIMMAAIQALHQQDRNLENQVKELQAVVQKLRDEQK